MFKTVGILVILFVSMMIVSCSKAPEKLHQKFNPSDVVEMKIDGRKGMVLSVTNCLGERSCIYNVRFSTGSVRTDTHVFGEDGLLRTTPYETLLVYEYELALAKID